MEVLLEVVAVVLGEYGLEQGGMHLELLPHHGDRCVMRYSGLSASQNEAKTKTTAKNRLSVVSR